MIGETIGNFRVVSLLGSGGMGDVYVAEQKDIGTRVAIKLLQAHISKDTEHVQRFFNEARAVSRIKHAGTVKISDVGFHASGRAYLIMDFLEGETLSSAIAHAGRMSVGQISDIGKQIASVLAATHDEGVTHRDLKPDNIFLCPDAELDSGKRVKILDFGIAKLTGTLGANSPQTRGTMGTPAYMAPEQWGNSANVDWRADAYSLGCVAFEMATGRPPFVGESFADFCAKHLAEQPVAASSIVRGLPPGLDALLAQLLSKKAADRGGSMKEISRRFAALDDGSAPLQPTSSRPDLAAIAPTVPPDQPTVAPVPPTIAPAPKSEVPIAAFAPSRWKPEAPAPVAPNPTTLSSAAGETPSIDKPRSRLPLIAGASALVVVGGVAIWFVTHRPSAPEPRPVAAVVADAGLDATALAPHGDQILDSTEILGRKDTATEVLVKHVLVGWKDLEASRHGKLDPRAKARTNAEAAKLALDVAAKLRATPTAIDALVTQYSEDPGSLTGEGYTVNGDTPFVPEFKSLALRLKMTEVGIVRTTFGYHVIERVPPPPPDPLESSEILARLPVEGSVDVQHVLVGWKDTASKDSRAATRTKADADALAKQIFDRASAGGDMKKLMKEFSEDPGTSASGAAYTISSNMVEGFRQLSSRLRLGEVGLVKTQFGWHIIKRVAPDATPHVAAPTPPKPCDARALMEAGQQSIQQGMHAKALGELEASLACHPDPMVVDMAFLASCNAKNADKAKHYYAMLSASRRAQLSQICLRNGIALE